MDRVFADVGAEEFANRVRVCLCRIGRSHDRTVLRDGVFAPEREHCVACLRDQRWNAVILCHLALDVLHRVRPRSLLVDFRPPPKDLAQARRISTAESDVDIGMHAYEIFCRLRRYSRYRDAAFQLLFGDAGRAWLFTG